MDPAWRRTGPSTAGAACRSSSRSSHRICGPRRGSSAAPIPPRGAARTCWPPCGTPRPRAGPCPPLPPPGSRSGWCGTLHRAQRAPQAGTPPSPSRPSPTTGPLCPCRAACARACPAEGGTSSLPAPAPAAGRGTTAAYLGLAAACGGLARRAPGGWASSSRPDPIKTRNYPVGGWRRLLLLSLGPAHVRQAPWAVGYCGNGATIELDPLPPDRCCPGARPSTGTRSPTAARGRCRASLGLMRPAGARFWGPWCTEQRTGRRRTTRTSRASDSTVRARMPRLFGRPFT